MAPTRRQAIILTNDGYLTDANIRHLTSSPLNKMATILADNIFKCIFLNENDRIQIQIWLKFVPRGSTDNKSSLVLVMVRHQTGDKPFPEPMLTQFTEAYMRH